MNLLLLFLLCIPFTMGSWYEDVEIPYISSAMHQGKNFLQGLSDPHSTIPAFFTILKGSGNEPLGMDDKSKWLSPKLVNPMSMLKKTLATARPKPKSERLKEACDKLEGVIVERECYKLVLMELEFESAREVCMKDDGDLWTPSYDDPDLLEKFVPAVIDSDVDGKSLWIGSRRNGGKITLINGTDVSNTYLGVLDDDATDSADAGDGCSVYNFIFGSSLLYTDLCETEYNFICEYKIDLDKKKHMNDLTMKDMLVGHIFKKG